MRRGWRRRLPRRGAECRPLAPREANHLAERDDYNAPGQDGRAILGIAGDYEAGEFGEDALGIRLFKAG